MMLRPYVVMIIDGDASALIVAMATDQRHALAIANDSTPIDPDAEVSVIDTFVCIDVSSPNGADAYAHLCQCIDPSWVQSTT